MGRAHGTSEREPGMPPRPRGRPAGPRRSRLEALGDYTRDHLAFRLRIAAEALEDFPGDRLVGLDVAQAGLDPKLVGDRGDGTLADEALLGQPAAEGLLVELALGVAAEEEPLVALAPPIAARVGAVQLVGEDEPALEQAELVLRVDEDEPRAGGQLLPPAEEGQGRALHLAPDIGRHEARGDDLGPGDRPIVPPLLLRGGRDEGDGEALVPREAAGEGDPGHALAVAVVAPRGAGQVAAHDHLDREHLDLADEGGPAQAQRDRVAGGQDVVRDEVGASLEPPGGNPGQDLALERHGREDAVEGGDPVARDEEEALLPSDDVPDLAPVDGPAAGRGLVQGGKDPPQGELDVAAGHAPRSERLEATREMSP